VFILKELQGRERGIIGHERQYDMQMAVGRGAGHASRLRVNGRGCMAANTEENSIEVLDMSSHLLGIIRMEREGIEKTEGWGVD
jgi:hypothetical protein